MKLVIKSLCLVAFMVLASCAEEASMLVPKTVIPKDDFSEKPSDFTVFNPKVDILFVIDNSGSMSTVQQNLARNAQLFADALSKISILDYHIGVTTTDMDYCHNGGGNAIRCGRLAGFPAYVERSTPNMVAALSRNMIVGTNGSAIEMMFTPIEAALTVPMENGPNAGFYRPDAYLAVIFITDADDQSRMTPQGLYQFLVQKKGDSEKVLGYGVIRTLADKQSCYAAEDITGKNEAFLDLVANANKNRDNILSLCASDYGVKLAEFAKDIVTRSAGRVKLSRLPVVRTIRVFYGAQEIPNDVKMGWVYEPSTNTILLSEGIEWDRTQVNAELRVDFEAIDTTPR